MIMILNPNQQNQQNQPFAFNQGGGIGWQFNQVKPAPKPVDPLDTLRAHLATQRALFNPNYMQNYMPVAPAPVQGLLDSPMVTAYNAAHGFNSQPGVSIAGGDNPLVAAYNAAKGYK